MKIELMQDLLKLLDGSVSLVGDNLEIKDPAKLKKSIHQLVKISSLDTGEKQAWARYLVRELAAKSGIYPASINDLYMGRGKGIVPSTFTVPAMNLRVLPFEAAKAVFRVALSMNAAAMIFEIARSEMNYCALRPSEYATCILGAAIAEGYVGPVFIQGDHFQVSAKKYTSDPKTELDALYALIRESVAAGFFNIDVDASTLVDIEKPTVKEQQVLNVELSSKISAFIRSVEPKGVTISIGGEIGEVGGHNSTEEELRTYLDGFNEDFQKLSKGSAGLSKVSIQTGTSHGGVVLPDGSIAQVSVDFDTMKKLSRISRDDYKMGGAVQHGASTLPENAFGKFVEAEACEIHLATNFMTMFFDLIPDSLREEMYAYLREKHAADRKPDMSDEQFYYKTRKNAVGPFKAQSWELPDSYREKISKAWEDQFRKLFQLLGLKDTRNIVEKMIKPVIQPTDKKAYFGELAGDEDVSDLAD